MCVSLRFFFDWQWVFFRQPKPKGRSGLVSAAVLRFSDVARLCVSTEQLLEWIPVIEWSLVALIQREGQLAGTSGMQSFPDLPRKVRMVLQFSFAEIDPAPPGAL